MRRERLREPRLFATSFILVDTRIYYASYYNNNNNMHLPRAHAMKRIIIHCRVAEKKKNATCAAGKMHITLFLSTAAAPAVAPQISSTRGR